MSGFQTAGAGANQQWLNQGAANGAAPMAVSHPGETQAGRSCDRVE